MIGWKLDQWPSTKTDMRRLERKPPIQAHSLGRWKFIKKCGISNMIKGLRYIKGNNLIFAMKFKGPVPVVPNKGKKIRGGSLLTKSVLPVVDKFVFFQIFLNLLESIPSTNLMAAVDTCYF